MRRRCEQDFYTLSSAVLRKSDINGDKSDRAKRRGWQFLCVLYLAARMCCVWSASLCYSTCFVNANCIAPG